MRQVRGPTFGGPPVPAGACIFDTWKMDTVILERDLYNSSLPY